MTVDEIIEKTVRKTIKELNKKGMVRYTKLNSFTRTEKILYLYPKLNSTDPMKKRVESALMLIRNDDYFGVIESYFFEGMTFEQIAEIYDVNYRTISRQRVKLVKILAQELFPNEVIKEILED